MSSPLLVLNQSISDTSQGPQSLVFLDSSLLPFVDQDSLRSQESKVWIINPLDDGITQISQALSQYKDIQSVSIISHGNSALLHLGSSTLSASTLEGYRQELHNWSKALAEDADLLFFGCNLAADTKGKNFVNALATVTGADIAASTDLTGSRNLGGNWNLEYQTGTIEARPSFPDLLANKPDVVLFTFDKAAYTAASVMDFTALGYTYDKDTNLANGNRFDSLPSNAVQKTGLEVRKNAADLTQSEINAFVNVVKTLKSTAVVTDNGITTNVYDQFVATHTAMRDAQGRIGPDGLTLTNPGHRGNAFLPWHRAFLSEFEEALQKVDPSVTIPYWDWTDQSSTFSKLFRDGFLGPNGTASSSNEVLSGPFSRAQGWQVRRDLTGSRWSGIGTATVGLSRRFGGSSGTVTLGTAANVANALNTNSYGTFRNSLEAETGLHNNTHNWVGGLMGNVVASANDPVFWMLHANVDRIWAEWQLSNHWGSNFYPASGQPYGHNLNDPLFPWDGGAIKIAADLQDLLPNIPKKVTITSIIDNVGSTSGVVPRGGSTDDTAPVLSGSLSNSLEAGETLVVFRNGVQRGTATVNGKNWSYSDTGLIAGKTYFYTARVIESASANFSGNKSPLSGAYKITIQSASYSGSPQFNLMTGEGSSNNKPLLTSDDEKESNLLIDRTTSSQAEIRLLIDAAVRYWTSQGVDRQGLQKLGEARLLIDNLGDFVLGDADPLRNVIRIDHDAAGHGWSTSLDEVTPTKVDLLSILTHEFGHILGYDHSVMGESVGIGERRLPLDFKSTHQPIQLPATRTYPRALFGTKVISTDLTNSGVVSPGNSIGSIQVKGNYQQLADSILTIEIAGRGKGHYDVLNISGKAVIHGTLNLYFLDKFEPQAGDTFTFLKASKIKGEFDKINVFGLNYSYDFELEQKDGDYILRVLGPKDTCHVEHKTQTHQDSSHCYHFSSHGFASTRSELTSDKQGALYNPAFGEDLMNGHYLYQFHGEHDPHHPIDPNFFVPITQREPEMLASVLRGESPPQWAIAPSSKTHHPGDEHSNDPSDEGSHPSHGGGLTPKHPDHHSGTHSISHHPHLSGQHNNLMGSSGGYSHHGSGVDSHFGYGVAHHFFGQQDRSHNHQRGEYDYGSFSPGHSASDHDVLSVGHGHDHDAGEHTILLADAADPMSHDHSSSHGGQEHGSSQEGHEHGHREQISRLVNSHDLNSHVPGHEHVRAAQTTPHSSSGSGHSPSHSEEDITSGESDLPLFHAHDLRHHNHSAGLKTIALVNPYRSQTLDPALNGKAQRLTLHDHDSGEEDLEDLLEDVLLKSLLIALTTSQMSNHQWPFQHMPTRAIASPHRYTQRPKRWPRRIRVRSTSRLRSKAGVRTRIPGGAGMELRERMA